LSPFVAEVVEEGIPTAIEDGGLRHCVLFRGTTAPTLRIIAGFRSTFQMRAAGYRQATNPFVALVGSRTPTRAGRPFDASVDPTEARSDAGSGPGHRIGRHAALIRFTGVSARASTPQLEFISGARGVPGFPSISGSLGLNQRFRLVAKGVRFQPVVQVQS
jgi:hypothetical protein